MRPTYFRTLVQQRRWTFEALCIQWKRAATELADKDGDPRLADVALSRRTFDRWMKGDISDKGPRPDTARILEYLFGLSVTELFGPPPGEQQVQAVIGPPSGMTASATSAERSDEWGSAETILFQAGELMASNTDPALLVMVRESIDDIVNRYEVLGPQLLQGETRLLRRMLHTLLHGRQSAQQRRDLFSLASQASGLLGYMAVNAGRPEHAQAYCVEAESLADMAQDVTAKMWALGTRALGHYYTGDYAASDAAAAAGVALAPRDPQAIRLLINGRARALARLGDRNGANRAIGQALDLSDRQRVLPDGITACISFEPYSPARTLANAVTAHLSLGETQQVQQYADQLEDLIERSDSQWTRALVSLDVASSLLLQEDPDIEQGVALGRAALRAGGATPIRSVYQRATELLHQAYRWRGEVLVREYAEELRALAEQAPLLTGGDGRQEP
ncbi:hypothetical protein ABZX38_35760 [Streptomyces longwoodensis]|uniref:hypothetical protein n=1 Tax=Streptomyces longwoodensis TaxID=68231 RepID=UPI0033B3CC8E